MKLKNIINEVINEVLLNEYLTYEKLPIEIKTAIEKNITVGVTFVKTDGSVRHMAFRRFLKSYEHSTAEKSEKQINKSINNNMINVYDTNTYIHLLKTDGDSKLAAKGSYRFIKFNTILAFLCGGKLYDMRNINNIAERYGEEIYNNLSNNMKILLNKDIEETNKNL